MSLDCISSRENIQFSALVLTIINFIYPTLTRYVLLKTSELMLGQEISNVGRTGPDLMLPDIKTSFHNRLAICFLDRNINDISV